MRLQLGIVSVAILFGVCTAAHAQVRSPRDYFPDRPPSSGYVRPPSDYYPDRPSPYRYDSYRAPSYKYVPDRPPVPGYSYARPRPDEYEPLPSSSDDSPPFYNYNYDRAYRHFLTSPYSYRTFSSLGQGYRADVLTPFSSQSFYREPGYEHQRISPRGLERYSVVPGYGEDTATPFWWYGYRVPSYSRQEFMPYAPDRR